MSDVISTTLGLNISPFKENLKQAEKEVNGMAARTQRRMRQTAESMKSVKEGMKAGGMGGAGGLFEDVGGLLGMSGGLGALAAGVGTITAGYKLYNAILERNTNISKNNVAVIDSELNLNKSLDVQRKKTAAEMAGAVDKLIAYAQKEHLSNVERKTALELMTKLNSEYAKYNMKISAGADGKMDTGELRKFKAEAAARTDYQTLLNNRSTIANNNLKIAELKVQQENVGFTDHDKYTALMSQIDKIQAENGALQNEISKIQNKFGVTTLTEKVKDMGQVERMKKNLDTPEMEGKIKNTLLTYDFKGDMAENIKTFKQELVAAASGTTEISGSKMLNELQTKARRYNADGDAVFAGLMGKFGYSNFDSYRTKSFDELSKKSYYDDAATLGVAERRDALDARAAAVEKLAAANRARRQQQNFDALTPAEQLAARQGELSALQKRRKEIYNGINSTTAEKNMFLSQNEKKNDGSTEFLQAAVKLAESLTTAEKNNLQVTQGYQFNFERDANGNPTKILNSALPLGDGEYQKVLGYEEEILRQREELAEVESKILAESVTTAKLAESVQAAEAETLRAQNQNSLDKLNNSLTASGEDVTGMINRVNSLAMRGVDTNELTSRGGFSSAAMAARPVDEIRRATKDMSSKLSLIAGLMQNIDKIELTD